MESGRRAPARAATRRAATPPDAGDALLERRIGEERLGNDREVVAVARLQPLDAVGEEVDASLEARGSHPLTADPARLRVRLQAFGGNLGIDQAELGADHADAGPDVEERRPGPLERLPEPVEGGQDMLSREPEEAGRLTLGDEHVGVEVIPTRAQVPGPRAAQRLGALQMIAADPGAGDAAERPGTEHLELRCRDVALAAPRAAHLDRAERDEDAEEVDGELRIEAEAPAEVGAGRSGLPAP